MTEKEQADLHYEFYGELAQLGEHLPCTQGVKGSSPLFSTTDWEALVASQSTEYRYEAIHDRFAP